MNRTTPNVRNTRNLNSATNTRTVGHVTIGQRVRRYVLSLFVAFTFAAYAVHERQVGGAQAGGLGADGTTTALNTGGVSPVQAASAPSPVAGSNTNTVVVTVTPAPRVNSSQPVQSQPVQPAAQPTAAPVTVSNGQYRDGTYTGPTIDAYFGYVQVQAVVSGGKLVDVQWLSYPSDRRTSQRINSFATPRLKTEAIQSQSAQVNIISGATLTSEAFIQSLGSALSQARA